MRGLISLALLASLSAGCHMPPSTGVEPGMAPDRAEALCKAQRYRLVDVQDEPDGGTIRVYKLITILSENVTVNSYCYVEERNGQVIRVRYSESS